MSDQNYLVRWWTVPSFDWKRRRNGVEYIVHLFHKGDYACTCDAFQYSKDAGYECKHIQSVKKFPDSYQKVEVEAALPQKRILAVHDVLIHTITYTDGTQEVKVTKRSE